MQLILGSQSPRRKEILNFFNLSWEQVSPSFDEEAVPFQDPPQDYVKKLAQGKGDSLVSHFPSALILTADTIVYKEGKIYGKPKNEQEAFQHLKALIGGWHSVFTGVSVSFAGNTFQAVEESRVLFHSLTDEQIQAYHRSLPCEDKAGGYMAQGAGSLIIRRIEGCYYNVVGLPINALYLALKQAGIDLWNHLKRE